MGNPDPQHDGLNRTGCFLVVTTFDNKSEEVCDCAYRQLLRPYAARLAVAAVLAFLLAACGSSVSPASRMLASLPRVRYEPAGPYVGPDATNIDPPEIKLGPAGVPIVQYPGIGYQQNPVTVAQYGLGAYSRFLHNRAPADRDIAVRAADWLVSHQQPDGRWLYRFNFKFPGGSMVAPWASALAQGQAMSLLERVYRLTDQRRYRNAAVKALAPLERPVSSGGLQRCFRGDCRLPFLEEYPTTSHPSYVLNGFMFTLLGVYDLASVAPLSGARGLYVAGRHTLTAALPSYGRGGVATYDLASKLIASQGYQAIHVYLLRALNSLQPEAEYRYYANRWQADLSHAPG